MGLVGRKVAVIGAGIGGLAAALALAQRRAHVVLFEAAPSLGEVGAGLQIAPNGVAVLEALGLRDGVERVANLPDAVELRDHADGRRVARVPLGDTSNGRYGRPYWHLHRADLAAALAEAVQEAGVDVRLGTRVAEVAGTIEGEDLRVVSESAPPLAVDIVVAADGVRSALRDAWFAGPGARFTGHVAWRALVPADRLDPDLIPAGAVVTMGAGRHVVTYPLRGRSLLNIVAVEERAAWTPEGWSIRDDPAHLRAAFAGWGGGIGDILAAVDDCFLWGLFDHPPLAHATRGRIALLGDAWHPMLPYLAQGATMALEDAWVLASELDTAETPQRGLMAYEARRAARVARVQRASARNGRIYHLGGRRRRAMHLALRTADTLLPEIVARRFDWLYGADVVSAGATG